PGLASSPVPTSMSSMTSSAGGVSPAGTYTCGFSLMCPTLPVLAKLSGATDPSRKDRHGPAGHPGLRRLPAVQPARPEVDLGHAGAGRREGHPDGGVLRRGHDVARGRGRPPGPAGPAGGGAAPHGAV